MDLIKPGGAAHSAPRVRRFALKVQQFTGPVMAKSLEDTTFYRYHRLLAFNEVGGDPAAKALAVEAFHDAMKLRAREWPHGMTATSTHDTKRGEDARARLIALAEIPGEWTSAVARWKVLNAPHLVIAGRHARAVRRHRNTCSIRRCSAHGHRAARTHRWWSGCRPMR